MTIDTDAIRLTNRVGACAVGLAYADRSDAEALRELIDMAGGSAGALTRARSRLSELGTVDETVLRRAVHLLETAAANVPGSDDGSESEESTVVFAGPGH